MSKIGRRRPYTEIGIRRKRCAGCGAPARHQWSACAIGNRWVPLCTACDIQVNMWFLEFINAPDRAQIAEDYRQRVMRVQAA